MNLLALNTKRTSATGATLVTAAVGAMTKIVSDTNACGHVPWTYFALDLAAIAVGSALCYFGMPAAIHEGKNDPPPDGGNVIDLPRAA